MFAVICQLPDQVIGIKFDTTDYFYFYFIALCMQVWICVCECARQSTNMKDRDRCDLKSF